MPVPAPRIFTCTDIPECHNRLLQHMLGIFAILATLYVLASPQYAGPKVIVACTAGQVLLT